MKRILLTGASGFIGSFIAEEAVNRGYELYAGIRKSSNTKYLKGKNIILTELDFSDKNALKEKIASLPHFDYVIHNAGATRALTKSDFHKINFEYTKNLAEALIESNKIPAKFIYMSSLAAYGPGNPISLEPVKNSDKPYPLTSYGKSKLESELYIEKLKHFPYIFIRPTAVYGPREKDLYTVFKLIQFHLEFKIGSAQQHLSFVYVKDLIEAVFLSMESDQYNKGYFISDGKTYDARTLGNYIAERLHKKVLHLQIPLSIAKLVSGIAEFGQKLSKKPALLNHEKIRELEATNWKCDISPAINEFGYKPEYDLKKGVAQTIDWYKKEGWI